VEGIGVQTALALPMLSKVKGQSGKAVFLQEASELESGPRLQSGSAPAAMCTADYSTPGGGSMVMSALKS
jgi:hypothetical protein